ncbi:hypothetical protein BGZ47_008224, partial [Haplosporangium gracile]
MVKKGSKKEKSKSSSSRTLQLRDGKTIGRGGGHVASSGGDHAAASSSVSNHPPDTDDDDDNLVSNNVDNYNVNESYGGDLALAPSSPHVSSELGYPQPGANFALDRVIKVIHLHFMDLLLDIHKPCLLQAILTTSSPKDQLKGILLLSLSTLQMA